VCGRSSERAARVAATVGAEPSVDLDVVLADPEVEAVDVCVPTPLHREVAERAFGAGKHVFLEKPIANEIEDAAAIIAACEQAGVVLSVGHSYRRHAALRHMRALIDDGTMGRISFAEAIFAKDRGLGLKDPSDWRFRKSEMPGGCLMQIGIHQVDNMLYLLGAARSVFGTFRRLETAAEIEDLASVLITFESGAIATVSANYITADRFRLSLYGTNAIATFDLAEGLVLQRRGESTGTLVPVEPNDYLRDEIEEFAACIIEGRRPEVGGREAMAALAVVRAAIESAGKGGPVLLGDDARSLPRAVGA
ncbi:MAG: Gfo/Idh/MocA family protein, partial [Xanthobacteraceae bacterium]